VKRLRRNEFYGFVTAIVQTVLPHSRVHKVEEGNSFRL
jgi:hypothetical protein